MVSIQSDISDHTYGVNFLKKLEILIFNNI